MISFDKKPYNYFRYLTLLLVSMAVTEPVIWKGEERPGWSLIILPVPFTCSLSIVAVWGNLNSIQNAEGGKCLLNDTNQFKDA